MSDAEETPWRSLHPLSVAVNLLPRTWRFLRSAWPLLLAIVVGSRQESQGIVDLALLAVFFGGTVGSTVVHWATLRYRVHEGRLEIGSGLFTRQVRVIDPRRIQNVELVRNVFHRASGLVEVRIETASGTEVEGLLSALSEADGQALMDALDAHRAPAEEVTEPDEVLAHNDISDLLRYGATAARLGAGMVVAYGLLMEVTSWVRPDAMAQLTQGDRFVTFAALVAVLTGTWIVGMVTAVVRYYGFELVRIGDRLVATAGLFTTRRVELQRAKVQLVSVREPMVRRLAGFGSFLVETAAAREGAGGVVSSEAMVPVVRRGDVAALLTRALPGATEAVWSDPLAPPHANALKRRLLGAGFRAVFFGGLCTWWLWPWGLALAGALAVAFVLAALADHYSQGWRLSGDLLVARQGYVDRTTAVLSTDKIQSVEVVQGLFRRRWGIARVVVKVAGSAVALPDLAIDEALEVQRRLLTAFQSKSASS